MDFDTIDIQMIDVDGNSSDCSQMDFTDNQKYNSVSCGNSWATTMRMTFKTADVETTLGEICKIGIFGSKCSDLTTGHTEQVWSGKDQQIIFDLQVDGWYSIAKPRFIITPASSTCLIDTWILVRESDGQDMHQLVNSSFNTDSNSNLIISCPECFEGNNFQGASSTISYED